MFVSGPFPIRGPLPSPSRIHVTPRLPGNENILQLYSVLDSGAAAPALALECGTFDMMVAMESQKLSYPEELE